VTKSQLLIFGDRLHGCVQRGKYIAKGTYVMFWYQKLNVQLLLEHIEWVTLNERRSNHPSKQPPILQRIPLSGLM
jgi:hypothetical protein